MFFKLNRGKYGIRRAYSVRVTPSSSVGGVGRLHRIRLEGLIVKKEANTYCHAFVVTKMRENLGLGKAERSSLGWANWERSGVVLMQLGEAYIQQELIKAFEGLGQSSGRRINRKLAIPVEQAGKIWDETPPWIAGCGSIVPRFRKCGRCCTIDLHAANSGQAEQLSRNGEEDSLTSSWRTCRMRWGEVSDVSKK
ncbi:hypothetical protein C8R44DRAFT_735061 [Mycena epipterygia]|nr:hypothetical protein C8R44DRAFT_735061 [Mycena epipterygia]